MKVFVYPEKVYVELGAKRWEISWEELRASTEGKLGDDVDYDRDIVFMVASYPTKEKAVAAAKQILDAGRPYFGAISLTEQVVDWFVEEDQIAEWRCHGQTEEIS